MHTSKQYSPSTVNTVRLIMKLMYSNVYKRGNLWINMKKKLSDKNAFGHSGAFIENS